MTPPAPRKIGRPTVRTSERAKILCDAIGRGLPYTYAVRVAGISFECFSQWRAADEKFRTQLETAVAEGVQKRLEVIERALESQDENVRLRSAQWFLEHTQSQFFAKSRLEVTGADGLSLDGSVIVLVWPHQRNQNPTPNEKILDAPDHRLADAPPGAN